jgi:hypothetical protein
MIGLGGRMIGLGRRMIGPVANLNSSASAD